MAGVTVCPYCGCGCGFVLQAEGGELTGVTPVADHPVSRGSLCVKGWKAYEFPNRPDRLRAPLVRDGGRLRETTWDVALDRVAQGLKTIRDRDGGDALGFMASAKVTNEENYLFQKLARAVFKTHNVDHCARL